MSLSARYTIGPLSTLFELWELDYNQEHRPEERLVSSLRLKSDLTMIEVHNKVRAWWSQYHYSRFPENTKLPRLVIQGDV